MLKRIETYTEDALAIPDMVRARAHHDRFSMPLVRSRHFGGALYDEVALVCTPRSMAADLEGQVRAVYASLLSQLRSSGAGSDSLVSETILLRHVEDAEIVLQARRRALGEAGAISRTALTVVGQAPVAPEARLEVRATALLPRNPAAHQVCHVIGSRSCGCGACAAPMHARVDRMGEHVELRAGDVRGCGASPVEEAFDMFVAAERLLTAAGMSFGDVVRTWIYVRDIDADYGALNQARRDFFAGRGIVRRPASTAVLGLPAPAAHRFSLALEAAAGGTPPVITTMSTPTLNEAWTYGADFSRGLRIEDANAVTLHVSGTASIDEHGTSVHIGYFDAQADRMFRNIVSLLALQGAAVADVQSAVTYLKLPGDAVALRMAGRRWGFDRVPCAVVVAPLCRPELLCETELVARVPLDNRR